MIYRPTHIKPAELMDQETFNKFGAEGLRYFRPEILKALDWIWEHYPIGASGRGILVNAWSLGGTTQWRGLRGPACPEYRRHSGHAVGAAVDFSAKGSDANQVRAWLKDEHAKAVLAVEEWKAAGLMYENPPILFVRRMEKDTPTWVHIDCLEHAGPGLLEVNP